MAFMDETAKAVYKNFSNSQMRELALAAKVSSSDVARMTSAAEANSVVDGISDKVRLALLAHRVEAVSPYKHCVLLESATATTYSSLIQKCRGSFAGLFSGFSPLDSSARDLHAQLCLDDRDAQRIFIKFAHMVEVYEFTKTPDGLLRKPAWRRHVMVVQLHPRLRLVSITFPGFSQPVTKGRERVTYNKFAVQVAAILERNLGLSLEGLKAKSVTDFLLDDPKSEVVDLRRTLRFERGGKMDLDSESDQDAATSLAQGLIASGVRVSAEAIRLAFRASEAQAIVLLWRKTGLITRFSLRDAYPEVLFVWNEADPSSSLVDDVLKTLAETRTFIGPSRVKDALQTLASMENGQVVRPTWLEQQFDLSPDQAIKILLDECTANRFCVVFRFRPDLITVPSGWVSSLADLPYETRDLEGKIVSNSDTKSIEVGFKRVVR